MMERNRPSRGTTVVEILISTAILLIVLGFAAVLFRQAFTHHTLTRENMSNEQQARLALARINSSLSQASVEINPSDYPTAAPPVIGPVPTLTSAPSISFYRVASLDPASMASPLGAPIPNYFVHTISYDPVNKQVDEFVIDVPSYIAGSPSPAPLIIAKNVTDFGVMQITSREYQFQITINDIINQQEQEQPKSLIDNVSILQ